MKSNSGIEKILMKTYPVADPTGAPPPKKIDQLCFLIQFFFFRMLKNKAQNARESIETTLKLPGPF